MPLVLHHAAVFQRRASPAPAAPWPVALPVRYPFPLTSEVLGCIGSTRVNARAFGVPAPLAPYVCGRLAGDISDQLSRDGFAPGETRRLVRKARRVDRLSRFTRASLESLCTTMPVTLAAGVGALVGAVAGAAVGGVGAIVGAPVGAVVGACVAAPAAAALSTAMNATDAKHRKGAGREYTERVDRGPFRGRAANALAYASGALVANAPLSTAQAISSVGMSAGLATTAIWGGAGLLAAPAISVGGVGLRVAAQEAMIARVPGRVFGLSRGEGPSGSVEWRPAEMQESLQRLRNRSTAGLVKDDMCRFVKLLRQELPGELRSALHPDRGLKQTSLNAGLLIGGQALGQGAGLGAGAAGVSDPGALAMARAVQHGPGAGAWGAGRPVSKPGEPAKRAHRANGFGL